MQFLSCRNLLKNHFLKSNSNFLQLLDNMRTQATRHIGFRHQPAQSIAKFRMTKSNMTAFRY